MLPTCMYVGGRIKKMRLRDVSTDVTNIEGGVPEAGAFRSPLSAA